jgi:hypothetical protein
VEHATGGTNGSSARGPLGKVVAILLIFFNIIYLTAMAGMVLHLLIHHTAHHIKRVIRSC